MCSCLLFFTAPHFHLGGRYHFHFLSTAIKFHAFISSKFISFVFNLLLRVALSLLSSPVKTEKFIQKKDLIKM